MFCTSCGAQVQSDQHYCSSCGARADSTTPLGGLNNAASSGARISKHASLLAILWIALAAWQLLRGAEELSRAHMVGLAVNGWFGPFFPAWRIPGFLSGMSFGSFAIAIGGFVVAVGIFERRLWARTLAIVLAVFALVHPLLGTALGIFTLWVFLPSDADAEWRRIARE
jgi:hypothetical protein